MTILYYTTNCTSLHTFNFSPTLITFKRAYKIRIKKHNITNIERSSVLSRKKYPLTKTKSPEIRKTERFQEKLLYKENIIHYIYGQQ